MTVSPLRPTTWPRVLAYEQQERGGLPFLGGPGIAALGNGGLNPLPLELLPELDRVDLDSEDAILGFVLAHCVLGAWPERFQLMRTADFGARQSTRIRRVMNRRQEFAMWDTDPNGEFLDEFRLAADGLRSLFAIVLELERPRFSATRLARDWPAYCPWPAPDSRSRAWWLLFKRINQGLQASPVAFWWVRDGKPTDGFVRNFEPGPPFLVHPATPSSLYGLCILELTDHLMADNPYRVCANETCGLLFSVQEGRSRHGGHRPDSRFHSKDCNNAQAAREYRRRQKEARR
jgi:hypothetical protein